MDYRELQAGQSRDNFWFKAKNDLIDILIKKASKNKKQLKILSIGTGTGDDLEILNKYGHNYVTDIDKDTLLIIDSKLCKEKKVADACRLPYKDNFFDIVVSFDVFEHIKNDKKSANEVHRVLKKDGVLIFTLPAYQILFSGHDRALNHHRRYNKKSIKTLLSKYDLKLFYWNSLLFMPAAIIRILKKKSKPKVDKANLPPWLNNACFCLLKVDNFFIKRNLTLPFGLSIAGFAYKRKK